MNQNHDYFRDSLKSGRPYKRPLKLLPLVIFLLLSACFQAFSQDAKKITITGTVTDSIGGLIENVSIVANGKRSTSTFTDRNGRFLLDVDPGSLIAVSYVGFQEQHFTASADRKTVTIVLIQNKTDADEVIVLAYGKKQRKEAVVGSVTTIKPGELKIPASNLTNALAGQAAGIIAYQRSGQPGQDNASFFVRLRPRGNTCRSRSRILHSTQYSARYPGRH